MLAGPVGCDRDSNTVLDCSDRRLKIRRGKMGLLAGARAMLTSGNCEEAQWSWNCWENANKKINLDAKLGHGGFGAWGRNTGTQNLHRGQKHKYGVSKVVLVLSYLGYCIAATLGSTETFTVQIQLCKAKWNAGWQISIMTYTNNQEHVSLGKYTTIPNSTLGMDSKEAWRIYYTYIKILPRLKNPNYIITLSYIALTKITDRSCWGLILVSLRSVSKICWEFLDAGVFGYSSEYD